MRKSIEQRALDEELALPPSSAESADYLAWKEAKVKKSLLDSEDRSQLLPAAVVWETLGLEP